MVQPRYPVYVVSKGRAASRLTGKALDEMGVPYSMVVEPQEQAAYAAVMDPAKILTLPFSNLGSSIPARNWIWDHAVARGATRHWILDDNIRRFFNYNRRQRSKQHRARDGSPFRSIEDFVEAYANVALAGMQYDKFAGGHGGPTKTFTKPFILNTRIYSCILILNSIPFRWRGTYNEDTDLSLRVLKAGWVTMLFYAFLCQKVTTMQVRGGNTEALYYQNAQFDGRLAMAESLARQHPDVVHVSRKWGRWQHHADFRPFKANRLIRASQAAAAGGQP